MTILETELLAALEDLFNSYCRLQQTEQELYSPDGPWTPEKYNDEAAMKAKSLLARLTRLS